MAINFPSNPSNGDTYEDPISGLTWKYDASTNSWSEVSTDLRPVISSPTAPDPVIEDYIWFDTANLEQYVGYKDPNDDLYWIKTSQRGPEGPQGPQGTSDPNLISYTYPGGVEQTTQKRLEQYVSVVDFGADPTGSTDSSAAFRAAFSASQSVYVPAGRYLYDGDPITDIKQISNPDISTDKSFHLWGAGQACSYVIGGSGRTRTFMDVSQNMRNIHVHDMAFFDLKDTFKFTATGVNVSNVKQWNNCLFEGYTGCAISQQQADSPYWKVKDCTFKAYDQVASMGVAFGDNCNLSEIEGNAFIRNRVHVKLRGGGVDVNVSHNDFLQFSEGGSNRVDVWIVANPTKGAGQNFTFQNNKLGNENIKAGDYRIVIADELAGAHNGDMFPDLVSESIGTKVLSGMRFISNKIQGAAVNQPFIYSTQPRLTDIFIDDLCAVASGGISYLVEFAASTLPVSQRSYLLRFYIGTIFGEDYQQTSISPIVSNTVVQTTYISSDDNYELFPQSYSSNYSGLGANRTGYFLLTDTRVENFTAAGGASKISNLTDSTGEDNAATYDLSSGLTYPTIGSAVQPGGTNGNGTLGDPVWLHYELKQSSSDPIEYMSVGLRYTNNGEYIDRRIVRVPPNWTQFRFPAYITKADTAVIAEFKKFGSNGSRVDIGRLVVYSSKDPVIHGVATFDSVKLSDGTSLAPVRGSLTPDLRTSGNAVVPLDTGCYMYYCVQGNMCTLMVKIKSTANLTEPVYYNLIDLPASIRPSSSLDVPHSLGTATITNNNKATVFAVTVSGTNDKIRIYMSPTENMSGATSFTLEATYPVGSFS